MIPSNLKEENYILLVQRTAFLLRISNAELVLPLYLWVCGVLSTHHQYTLESCLWSSDNNMDGMFHWTVLEQNVFTEVKMRIFHILLFWASSSMAAVPVPVILMMIFCYKQNEKSRWSSTPTWISMSMMSEPSVFCMRCRWEELVLRSWAKKIMNRWK